MRPSARCAFTFESSRAFSSRSLQAASAHAGNTSDTNAIHLPSGDHVTPEAPVAIVVSLLGSPPAAGMTHTCGPPSRFEMNATCFPSGDHRGRSSDRSVPTIFAGAPPAVGTTQMSLLRVFASRLTSVTTNATFVPSGDNCGSDTRFSFSISSTVKAAGPCAHTSGATASVNKTARPSEEVLRFIVFPSSFPRERESD